MTLEPCAHQGRRPPCTGAILPAGVARVVIASDDPSEKARGRGPGILRDEGIEVELANGPEASAARLLNQAFRKHTRTGRPLVLLKSALSLDGRVASASGDSRWISGEDSRALAHRLAGRVRCRVRRDRHRAGRRPAADREGARGGALGLVGVVSVGGGIFLTLGFVARRRATRAAAAATSVQVEER